MMDDGRVVLRVLEGGGERVSLKALTDATITSRKNIVIQGRDLELPTITEREVEAVKFAVQEGFDYIGLSYVRGAEDISMLKGMLLSLGAKDIGIIAKIETPTAVNRLEEIVDSADIILVARGDLGMYFSLEEIPRLQERIVDLCIEKGKPVIVATQILGSMVESPVPTRGEIIDVVSAIRQGVDVLMLTGETAIGRYPVEVVKWLSKIIETYEPDIIPERRRKLRDGDVRDRFAYGVVSLAESLDAVIGVYTRSGRTAMRIASFRPRCRIFSASNSKRTLRKLALIWGIESIMVSSKDYEEGLDELQSRIERLIGGKIMVLTYGLREEALHTVRIVQSRRA
ncbi:MAG: pyruvate kinase [Thaumarchaeota archaeon]|nr:MAG: pyruvate kinase [Nitrososphaerota archaeon]